MKNLFLIISVFVTTYFYGQSPQLNVKGKDSSLVRLSQLKVSVKVVGNSAYTTTEMHFFNGTNRQMEAELLFPLPEGVSVSRYAIDINGKMREAVPVNKNKGKQVFEAIEHRRVDPGLLEKVEGNNFRTRIYPLLPGKERIVIIGYEQELNLLDASHLSYQMLTNYPVKLDVFELKATVIGASAEPQITTDEGLVALEHINENYQFEIIKSNYKPKDSMIISIPIRAEIPSVVLQSVNNQHYFYSNILLESTKIKKQKPNSIGLLWDVSLSCKKRNLKKELQLLDAYFTALKNVDVALYFSGYAFEKQNNYSVKNGDWSALKTILEGVHYDGGSRFSKVKLPVHDEYLFFTDGLSSLSANLLPATKKPIYTISSIASSDFAFLNYNAIKTGGNFINLNEFKIADATDKLLFQNLKFLGIKENFFVTEMYPMVGSLVSGNFSLAGISLKENNQVTLQFGYDQTPIFEKVIIVDASKQASNEVSIEKLWAQKKIATLEIQYKINADEIESMGKKYGIITQNTSLIVLENLQDYIQYEIIPPAELRDEFDRIMKQQIASAKAKQYSNWENVAQYYDQLVAWWNNDVKYTAPKPQAIKNPKKKLVGNINTRIVHGIISDNSGALPGASVVIKGTNKGTQTDFDGNYSLDAKVGDVLVISFVGMNTKLVTVSTTKRIDIRMEESNSNLQEVVVTAMGMRRDRSEDVNDDVQKEEENETEVTKRKVSEPVLSKSANSNVISALAGKISGVRITNSSNWTSTADRKVSSSDTTAIDEDSDGYLQGTKTKVSQWNPDRLYLKILANAPEEKRYELYLELRADNETNPSFYFDVANYFYDNGDKEKGLLILSSIADLGLENHQLYKSLTYILRQWQAYDDALFTASQVAKWRNQEPQAHRDLALALEDTKHYQAAFDELIKALETNYFAEMRGQYEGVEDIILMDINRMITEHKAINTNKLDKKYKKSLPVDVRIILNWNQMDTDIDLHIIEPTNEECYYGHRDTQAGARFSKDFTQGYGPEQYLLRNAVKGKFVIKTNFFGERTLTENGPTTVMVEIYTTKNGKTERTLQTIQLGSVRENQNLAEITIN